MDIILRILATVVQFGLYAISIGLSDTIELFFNPTVHEFHNAPDISGKSWEQYGCWDAFYTGIKCCIVLVLPLVIYCILGIVPLYFWIPCFINPIIPIVCYLTNLQEYDLFLCHKLLYGVGAVFLLVVEPCLYFYNLYLPQPRV